MNDVNYDVLDRSKDIHSCFQCKQMNIYVDNLIKRYRTFRVLDENVFEKIRTCSFLFSWKWKVCAVAKILQLTSYPTVIENQKDPMREREREIIERRRRPYSNLGPFLE